MIRRLVFRILLWWVACRRDPDFVIGPSEDPYLRRWWILPRNRWVNLYLHQILHNDDDRALHDHPWWNVSWLLSGGYVEWVPEPSHLVLPPSMWGYRPLIRREGQVIVRRATDIHRLAVIPSPQHRIGYGHPCWSLFFTGRVVRTWGFWCPQGFRPWRDFVAERNKGEVGAGCGET